MAEVKESTTVAQRDRSYGRLGGGIGSLLGAGFGIAAPIALGASLGGSTADATGSLVGLDGLEGIGRLGGGVAGLTAAPLTGAFGAMAGDTIGKNIGQEAASVRTSLTPSSRLAREHVRGTTPEDAMRFQQVAHGAGADPATLRAIDEEVAAKHADLDERNDAQVYNDAGLGPRSGPDFALHGKRVGRGTGALVGNTLSKWVVSPVMGATGAAANKFIPEPQAAVSQVLSLPDHEVHDYVNQIDLDPNTPEGVREAVSKAMKLRQVTEQTNPKAQPEGSLASPLHSA